MTARYYSHVRDGKFDPTSVEKSYSAVRKKLCRLHVVVVPSFMAGFVMRARTNGIYDFFVKEERFLRREGATTTIAPVNPAGSARDNATILADIILRSERPVCIVSHSKGGLDTLEMLLNADASLRSKIVCWIALQAPFYGTPAADTVTRMRGRRYLLDPIFALMRGSPEALRDLTTIHRARYISEREVHVANLTNALPILSVATSISANERVASPSFVTALRRLVDWQGELNDGAVPTASQILPNSNFVKLHGIDHVRTVTSRLFGPTMDRTNFIKLVFALILSDKSTHHDLRLQP